MDRYGCRPHVAPERLGARTAIRAASRALFSTSAVLAASDGGQVTMAQAAFFAIGAYTAAAGRPDFAGELSLSAPRLRMRCDAAGVDRMPPCPTITRPTPLAAAIFTIAWMATNTAMHPTASDTATASYGRRWIEVVPLDAEASGLMVLTQDGRAWRRLTEDGDEIEQEYVVEVSGDIGPWGLKKLNHGLHYNGRALPPCKVRAKGRPAPGSSPSACARRRRGR